MTVASPNQGGTAATGSGEGWIVTDACTALLISLVVPRSARQGLAEPEKCSQEPGVPEDEKLCGEPPEIIALVRAPGEE